MITSNKEDSQIAGVSDLTFLVQDSLIFKGTISTNIKKKIGSSLIFFFLSLKVRPKLRICQKAAKMKALDENRPFT